MGPSHFENGSAIADVKGLLFALLLSNVEAFRYRFGLYKVCNKVVIISVIPGVDRGPTTLSQFLDKYTIARLTV